jgi:hypothetical protein
VEAEKLRKEVSDKEELICQASRAFERAGEKLKEIREETDIDKEEMKSQIQELETVS